MPDWNGNGSNNESFDYFMNQKAMGDVSNSKVGVGKYIIVMAVFIGLALWAYDVSFICSLIFIGIGIAFVINMWRKSRR